jgi:hypothetical protein
MKDTEKKRWKETWIWLLQPLGNKSETNHPLPSAIAQWKVLLLAILAIPFLLKSKEGWWERTRETRFPKRWTSVSGFPLLFQLSADFPHIHTTSSSLCRFVVSTLSGNKFYPSTFLNMFQDKLFSFHIPQKIPCWNLGITSNLQISLRRLELFYDSKIPIMNMTYASFYLNLL